MQALYFAKRILPLILACAATCLVASGCAPEPVDMALTQNVRVEMVDWHVAGLWVINCPVVWFRVYNYNNVPIHDITISYVTYDFEAKPMDHGTYTIDGTVAPMGLKNFVEQYVGLVSVESDRLSIKLESVKAGESGGH